MFSLVVPVRKLLTLLYAAETKPVIVQFYILMPKFFSPGVVATNLHRRAGQTEEQYAQVRKPSFLVSV